MQVEILAVERLTKEAFAPFGDVIEVEGAELRLINNGTTERFHDLARVEAAGTEARVLINIFRGQSFEAPIDIVMMERHPFGSQAFIPLNGRPFLVVVAEDVDDRPVRPRVFSRGAIRASTICAMSGTIRFWLWNANRIFWLSTERAGKTIWRNSSSPMRSTASKR